MYYIFKFYRNIIPILFYIVIFGVFLFWELLFLIPILFFMTYVTLRGFKSLGSDNFGSIRECSSMRLYFYSNPFFYVMFPVIMKQYYFNPLLFLFGFKYYRVTLHNWKTIIFITKRRIKTKKDIKKDDRAYRINDYTFIEL